MEELPRHIIEQDMREVDDAFEKTVKACVQALEEVADVTLEMTPSFWNSFYVVLSRFSTEKQELILTRAEAISAEYIAEENRVFETKTLPKVRRQAYMRGFMSVFGASLFPPRQ